MKVVAFNGSPRKDGNTTALIHYAFRELESAGLETDLVQLSGKKIHGCRACYKCFENKDRTCSIKDFVNEAIEKIIGADGVILASPVYFADVTAEMKALIDRAGFVSRANGGLYVNKVGASLVTLRRTGGIVTVDSLNHFFLAAQMIIAGRAIAINPVVRIENKNGLEKDQEGIQMVKTLGQRMAWLLKKVHT